MKNNRLYIILLLFLSGFYSLSAQDLLKLIEQEQKDTVLYTLATFKATRIAIGQSVETRKKGVLEWQFMSRFWNIPDRRTQSFIADKVSARIGLVYGVSDRLSFGLGGTTWDGIFDGFLKYRLIWQRTDKKGAPFSITLFQNASYRSDSYPNITATDNFRNRLSFTSQLLIARKFTPNFSLQLTPTYIHRGSLLFPEDRQNLFALGLGARYKVNNHLAVVSEYHYLTNPIRAVDTFDAFAIGVNWEASDVILQFYLTNARNIEVGNFSTQTFNNFNFNDGNLHFGFNFTYVLHLKKKR
ncbi:hypothetical protein GWK08_08360 [Leptobacterium flavescens]|uniref:DUF5777 domain-containing protein n=1 Tax=Leptobacterium flavescens TaxID=472055 RepID=A0A6P0UJG8_9FLAO|nr:DUF5777 family beta-barrel protein [Leptobacterium flavescens]NER13445.1 hypothetical protein [Leptobacterium flavescens]